MTGEMGDIIPPRGQPMPVKYWSSAGLMLTDWCNAACACCYANCSPADDTWLDHDDALAIWAGLIEAGAHGCRVHLTGGEVFGRFDSLIRLCRDARDRGLGPLEAVETNGYWASDEQTVRQRLTDLDDAGMERMTVSSDPYHQQFVPLERPRLLVRVAEEILGPARVRVRWREWLENGRDLVGVPQDLLNNVFTAYAGKGRDRFTGRAADGLDAKMLLKPVEELDDNPCNERILRGRHVHIAPTGEVWPATCIGIVVGNVLREPVRRVWERLYHRWTEMPIIATLARRGPVGLLQEAIRTGFSPRPQGYVGKCQLCYHVRRHWMRAGLASDQLGPDSVYRSEVL